jgi:aryl-alcohol dehydrogenase-like predicted oxidoreductase
MTTASSCASAEDSASAASPPARKFFICLIGYLEMIELGLGLLSIGRPWGRRPESPPPESEALALLGKAVALSIRFFDTAPAYGRSEAILGRFVRGIGKTVVVSTKMGEWWDPVSGVSTVDHHYASLKRSIDRSLELLGHIDLLQVHKATAENLASPDVARAIEYARACGVRHFGASVADVAAANAAARTGWCSYLQFPFSGANTALAPIFALARTSGLKILVNRPFAMGEMVAAAGANTGTLRTAFKFIQAQDFDGIVLTGTKSMAHLMENHAAFHAP